MTVREIEKAVKELRPEELAAFREWFGKFDAEIWDRQFGDDVAAGKLDQLAEEASRDFREGRTTEL